MIVMTGLQIECLFLALTSSGCHVQSYIAIVNNLVREIFRRSLHDWSKDRGLPSMRVKRTKIQNHNQQFINFDSETKVTFTPKLLMTPVNYNRSLTYQVFDRKLVPACAVYRLESVLVLKRSEAWASLCSCVSDFRWIKHIRYQTGNVVH